MNKKYTGPIRQIEFDEGIGIKEIEETPPAGSGLLGPLHT